MSLNWSWIILFAMSLNLTISAIYFLFIAKPVENTGASFKEVGWPFKATVGLSYSIKDLNQTFSRQLFELIFSTGFWLNFASFAVVAIVVAVAFQSVRP